MTERFTSIDEFLEKRGQTLPLNWLSKALASPAGMVGVGALGAVGVTKALAGGQPGETLSYRINRNLHGLMDRIRADEIAGESFAKGLGSGTAEELIGLTKDIVTKGYESLKDSMMISPVRQLIFETLKKEDPTIARAPTTTLLEAYHTMAKFAPSLATDKNAVRSVLRTAATSGADGLDYNTIRLLAEAEGAIQKSRGTMR